MNQIFSYNFDYLPYQIPYNRVLSSNVQLYKSYTHQACNVDILLDLLHPKNIFLLKPGKIDVAILFPSRSSTLKQQTLLTFDRCLSKYFTLSTVYVGTKFCFAKTSINCSQNSSANASLGIASSIVTPLRSNYSIKFLQSFFILLYCSASSTSIPNSKVSTILIDALILY